MICTGTVMPHRVFGNQILPRMSNIVLDTAIIVKHPGRPRSHRTRRVYLDNIVVVVGSFTPVNPNAPAMSAEGYEIWRSKRRMKGNENVQGVILLEFL